MIDLPALVALHARTILQAREAEDLDYEGNPHRERERAEGLRLRRMAAALGEVLEPYGVQIPHPRQLSLLADGKE
jgi:hypothetical protein